MSEDVYHSRTENMPRWMRREAKKRLEKSIKNGWPPWNKKEVPDGAGFNGWVKDVRLVYENGLFAVLVREIQTEQCGKVLHLAIRNLTNTDIPWREKQRIKDELFGKEAYAVEVFPQRSRLIDGANMYHLWVLEKPLPFCLADDTPS